jgi:acyl transferase domain-containing protein
MAIDDTSSGRPQPIAVIGMACRFAGDATSPSKLWDLCTGERDAWSPIPQNRFDVNSFYDAASEKMGRVSHNRFGCAFY